MRYRVRIAVRPTPRCERKNDDAERPDGTENQHATLSPGLRPVHRFGRRRKGL